MEINREQFEKLTQQGQQEQKARTQKQADTKSKWEKLQRKYRVPEEPSQFPLVQYKPPEGFEPDF